MLTPEQLKLVVHHDTRSQRDATLLVLAVSDPPTKDLATIRQIGLAAGIRLKRWNLADILAKAVGYAIKTDVGWELTPNGRQLVAGLVSATDVNLVITTASQSLRQHLHKLTKPETVSFVTEAIVCFEARQYRAAVVLSWVGAVSVLHHHVAVNQLAAFNSEARRRDSKWREAKGPDDLGRMKEHEFLDVIEALGVIGRNVKQSLQSQLQLRNASGHPNTLQFAENTVAAHIEMLMLNVFSKF